MMKKRIFPLLLSLWALLLTAACGDQAQPPVPEDGDAGGTVELTVWGAEEDEALLQELFTSFQSHYAGQADFRITYQPQGESNCKDALLG
ncbi:MAG: maltose ABC transporter substrate-binding protein, partial [Oscillospiraceae bacterium]|nr:maltose ABC transporter substrate-binding protein [Oscillospiraceae bacterium]